LQFYGLKRDYPMRRRLAAVAVFILLVTPAVASWDGAVSAWKRADYVSVLHELRPFAEQGLAQAQAALGYSSEEDNSLKEDYAVAARWLRRAADQGDAAAQFNLGLLYASGEGMPKDNNEALYWIRKAAKSGHPVAQDYLDVRSAR
jgi:TPR repeat protein